MLKTQWSFMTTHFWLTPHWIIFLQVRLANLEVLDINGLGDVSVLFDFEGISVSESYVESLLGRLRSLKLERLPKLVNITRMVPEGIHVMQNLTSLIVLDCSNLRYLFSPSMANLLVALETLEVYECQEMEEIVGREKEGTSDIDMVKEGMPRRIVFPKLSSLELLSLDRFRMFCSQNYELVLPSLHKLVILYCPLMTKFCSGHLNAPELKQIQIGEGQYVDISNFFDDSGIYIYVLISILHHLYATIACSLFINVRILSKFTRSFRFTGGGINL